MRFLSYHFVQKSILSLLLLFCLVSLGYAQDDSTAFTLNYQGELQNANGSLLEDSVFLQFRLYINEEAEDPIW